MLPGVPNFAQNAVAERPDAAIALLHASAAAAPPSLVFFATRYLVKQSFTITSSCAVVTVGVVVVVLGLRVSTGLRVGAGVFISVFGPNRDQKTVEERALEVIALRQASLASDASPVLFFAAA